MPPVPEKIMPDGCIEIIFNYGRPMHHYDAKGLVHTQHMHFMHGQMTSFIELRPSGPIGFVAVRFMPAGAARFLRLPIRELNDREVQVDELFGLEGVELGERFANEPDNESRVRLLSDFFLNLLKTGHPDYLIEEYVRRVLATDGRLTVDQMTRGTRISARHLDRKFYQSVGMNPKAFIRIVRFQHALRQLTEGQYSTLTALSEHSGYYDLPHMAKDFRAFAGNSPGAFAAAYHGLSDHIVQER